MVYVRKLLSDLGYAQTEATSLASDSKAARDTAYNPEHHDKMKHVERRHFFVRDMVERLELEVPYCPTDENIADFLTKPLDSKKFFAMRSKIMHERETPA